MKKLNMHRIFAKIIITKITKKKANYGNRKLTRLGKLSNASAKRIEALTTDVGGAANYGSGAVVDLLLLQPEDVTALLAVRQRAIDDVGQVLPRELHELFEYYSRFFLV